MKKLLLTILITTSTLHSSFLSEIMPFQDASLYSHFLFFFFLSIKKKKVKKILPPIIYPLKKPMPCIKKVSSLTRQKYYKE